MGPSKKAVAKVPAKKEVVKKVAAPKPVKSSVKLVSFAVQATIPTQQYGNIMPRIEVVADSIEEARATVMPFIEEIYKTYAEKSRDGKPLFEGSKVEVTEKVVGQTVTVRPEVAERIHNTAPVAITAPVAPQEAPALDQATETPVEPADAPVQRSEPAIKAEKAISLAMTEEAAKKIKEQIEKSVKIPADEKPALIELVDAKITDFEARVW
jgi:hypothetical protein